MNRLLFLVFTSVLCAPIASADLRLEVDLSERELVALVDGKTAERYAISIGKTKYPTPKGTFRISKIIWNPSWRPPDSKWARGKKPKTARDPDNPMKRVKMFFKEPDYYIHGTGDETSLGKAESHGCVRMSPQDATRLAQLVMRHGGEKKPESWVRRLLRRKTTKVIRLSDPVPITIR